MTKNLRGHVTLDMLLLKKFLVVLSGLSLGTCVSNLKSVALTILELFAFNARFKLV